VVKFLQNFDIKRKKNKYSIGRFVRIFEETLEMETLERDHFFQC